MNTPSGETLSGWQQVATYPAASLDLAVGTWDANLATNQVTYQVSAVGESLAAPRQICHGGGNCRLYIEAGELAGGEVEYTQSLASSPSCSFCYWQWRLTAGVSTSQSFARPITHVRAYVRNNTTGEVKATGWQQVAIHPTELTPKPLRSTE